jgi:transcriptional regulator with XRE-family HTH domain
MEGTVMGSAECGVRSAESIGARLREARKAAGLRQNDFEDVHGSTVRRIETGKLKGRPELETIEALSRALIESGVPEATPAYLLGIE